MSTNETSVHMLLDRWNSAILSAYKLINELSEEAFHKEIAPGKNRGIYLLGHLVAVHDAMLPLMDLGEKKHPELYVPFITSPDKEVKELPTVDALKSIWTKQCDELKHAFDAMTTDDWFSKHTSVTAEDFAKEPNRNKLNILLTRTTHLTYHTGQLVMLK